MAATVTIQVVKKAGVWTIEPRDIDGDPNGNDGRYGVHKPRFEQRWKDRSSKPVPGHRPIIFIEGDILKFVCADVTVPFLIGAKKNSDVVPLQGLPDSPFGWSNLQPVDANSSAVGTVTTGMGVKAEGFYKFHGWVFVGGKFIEVDPDGYCGG